MDKKYIYFTILAFAGLTLGLFSQTLVDAGEEQGYCESVEEELRNNQSIDGPVVCSEPGDFEQQNLSEVKNRSELRCLCQYVINGETRTFSIRETQ